MKIYLSSSFTDRLKMRPVRDKLWSMGHNVVSTWLDETIKPEFITDQEWKRKLADKDRAEVLAADLFIINTDGISTGKAVELGLALGQFHFKLVWCVGQNNHIFHALADEQFTTFEEVYYALEQRITSVNLKDASS